MRSQHSSSRVRQRERRLALFMVLALIAPPPALAAADAADRPAASPVTVAVIKAEPQAGYSLEQVFVGRVEARRSAALGFERTGQLVEMRVREGDRVAAGALLARLDPSLLQAKRTELVADLASAEADLALAEATANRYRSSVDEGAVTRQDLDEASEGARAASARLQLAEARIASIDLDLRKTELRAPFAGAVIRRSADEGTVLSAGQPVLTLQDTANPEVRIGVAGPLLEALHPGQRYRLEIDGEHVPARLRAIIPLRAGTSRTVDALFDPIEQASPGAVDPPSDRAVLRPGNLAELRLSKEVEEAGFWLPLSALREGKRGLWRTLVAEPQVLGPEAREPAGGSPLTASSADTGSDTRSDTGSDTGAARWRLVGRSVQVLHVDRERVFVRGPLQPGALIVSGGLQRVVPGQWVRVTGAAQGDAAAAD